MHTMTPRQRETATKAHNMIYSYLRLRKLPIDDYYDVVVFGFMEAVQQYDENKELAKKYFLTTIAYRKMDDRLAAYRIYENRKKRTADVRSLEAPLAGAGGGGQYRIPPDRGTRHAGTERRSAGQGRRIYRPGSSGTPRHDTQRHLQPDSQVQSTRSGRNGPINQEEQNAILQHMPELRLQLRPRRELRLQGREGGDRR